MPLTVPAIDDRGYEQILKEALARISVHTPEWTNFNESDPGVTLLQLFAFMTDHLLYRANLIPERNRRKFLQLLGIPLRPASSAIGVVTVANQRGPLETVTLARTLPAYAGRVGFVTTNALDVLPIEGRIFLRRVLTGDRLAQATQVYKQLYGATRDDPSQLDFYETAPFDPPASTAALPVVDLKDDTVDRTLWLALLLRPGDEPLRRDVSETIAGKTLTLALMPSSDESERVLRPAGTPGAQAPPSLAYHVSTGRLDGATPLYRALEARADGDPFESLALVQLTLPASGEFATWEDLDPLEEGTGEFPPALEDDAVQSRLLAWVRIRLPVVESEDTSTSHWRARFSWAGINAARVRQQIAVVAERAGTGTGQPDQRLVLVNKPVIPETVVVTVGSERWALVDDLLAAPAEISSGANTLDAMGGGKAKSRPSPRVFTVDRESGEIRFGDGLRGARPSAGAPIVVSYAYGGGPEGNVGIGAINTSPQLPAGFAVSNPLPTWAGTEGESVAEAERSIPRQLRERDRAVSATDMRDIARRTPGVALGRVEVLPLFHPDFGAPAPGVVTLLVVPDDPVHPEAPVPDRLFLAAVCEHLEPRRLLTTEVHVAGPEYVGLSVAVGIDIVPGEDVAPVREAVKGEIREFLSPLKGGQRQEGWPLEKAVEDRELWARAARVDGVAKVRDLKLWDATGAAVARIEITGLQLPKLDRISARFGDPEDLLAEPAVPPPTGGKTKRVPVPVLPPEC